MTKEEAYNIVTQKEVSEQEATKIVEFYIKEKKNVNVKIIPPFTEFQPGNAHLELRYRHMLQLLNLAYQKASDYVLENA
jgi:hypothetical protein